MTYIHELREALLSPLGNAIIGAANHVTALIASMSIVLSTLNVGWWEDWSITLDGVEFFVLVLVVSGIVELARRSYYIS